MKIDKKYIWDYNLTLIDLNKPRVLHWYISRKINFGDWSALDSKVVKDNLKFLSIDSTLKKMLTNYYAH